MLRACPLETLSWAQPSDQLMKPVKSFTPLAFAAGEKVFDRLELQINLYGRRGLER